MSWPGADTCSRFLLVALAFFYGIAIVRGLQVRQSHVSSKPGTIGTAIPDRIASALNCIVPTLRSYEIIAFAWPLNFHLFPAGLRVPLVESSTLKIIGVILWTIALILYVWAQASMGRNWRVGTATDAELVTSGAFAWLRHPIYLAFGLMAWGTTGIFPNGGFLLLAVISLGLLQRQALGEERFLKQAYGVRYDDYCRNVGRWFRWF